VKWSPSGNLIGCVQRSDIVLRSFPSLGISTKYDLEYPSCVSFSADCSYIGLGTNRGGVIETFENAA
jgi:hypothetical protein